MRNFRNFLKYTRMNPLSLILNLPRFAKLFWRLFWDGRVQWKLKLMLVAAIVYFISPVDLIPELMVPVFGFADDFIVVYYALKYFLKFAPREVVEEHVRNIG